MPIGQRKPDSLRGCPYPDMGKIYYFLSYYLVRYLPNTEVLLQQQKADNIFNE
jgi:hypothetical protein